MNNQLKSYLVDCFDYRYYCQLSLLLSFIVIYHVFNWMYYYVVYWGWEGDYLYTLLILYIYQFFLCIFVL